MIDLDEMETDAVEMQADFPVTFSFNSALGTGCIDQTDNGLAMLDAGYGQKRSVNLVCILSQFPGAVPVTNDLITMDSKVWRVASNPIESPDGINITLPLVQST
jgi:hypothetical protein